VRDDAGVFDVDHTLPQTTTATTTQAQERSARSRSAERDRLPAGTTATPPESTRGAGRAASGTAQPSADATAAAPASSRSKSGAGAKGRCRHHLPTSGQPIGELAFYRATAGLENLKNVREFYCCRENDSEKSCRGKCLVSENLSIAYFCCELHQHLVGCFETLRGSV